jgi:hypothetical protein
VRAFISLAYHRLIRRSSSRKKMHTPSNSAPANGLASQSQATSSQQLQFPTTQSQSPQQSEQTQQSQPLNPWSAHTPPSGQWPSPLPRSLHALSTTATAAGELFLLGGRTHNRMRNDLYVISTRDFSTTFLRTRGVVPSPRSGHRAVLTDTTLLIWGGKTDPSNQNAQNQSDDDSFHLLNLGTSDLLMSRPAPADQSFLRSSIASVDPHRGQWSRARRSSLSYHDVGRFQAHRLRWHVRQGVFKRYLGIGFELLYVCPSLP